MTNQPASEVQQRFAASFFAALGRALTEASGAPWRVSPPDPASSAEVAAPVRIRLTLAGSLQGEILLELQRAGALKLASKLLHEEETAEEFGTEHSDALLKAIQAAANEFAAALLEEHGAVTAEASSGSDSDSASGLTNIAEVVVADEDASRATISMLLDAALAQALASSPEAAKSFKGQVAATGSDGATLPPVNLKLVMDVELNVTLRFGRRQLSLREVLDLNSGSVIELDRQVDEPVELLLDGVVIARGEAVVIDGNYGLRVTEVPQPITYEVLR